MRAAAPVTEVMPREGRAEAETEAGRSVPCAWADVEYRVTQGGWFWLATVRADGSPHVVPVFAAWDGEAFFVAAKDTTVKHRNLVADGRCVLTHDAGDLHLVVEGHARRAEGREALERASAAFAAVYDWPTQVVDGALDAPYGAPTSGGPPYGAFEVTPVKAFGFPTDGESFAPTRWRFGT